MLVRLVKTTDTELVDAYIIDNGTTSQITGQIIFKLIPKWIANRPF